MKKSEEERLVIEKIDICKKDISTELVLRCCSIAGGLFSVYTDCVCAKEVIDNGNPFAFVALLLMLAAGGLMWNQTRDLDKFINSDRDKLEMLEAKLDSIGRTI